MSNHYEKTPQQLAKEIAESGSNLDAMKRALEAKQRSCRHEWGKVLYVPDIRPAYHFAGDPPGTMGVDRQLPCDIPEQVTKKWQRTCSKCTLTQTTGYTRTQDAPGSVPGTTAKVEVPVFNEDRFHVYTGTGWD